MSFIINTCSCTFQVIRFHEVFFILYNLLMDVQLRLPVNYCGLSGFIIFNMQKGSIRTYHPCTDFDKWFSWAPMTFCHLIDCNFIIRDLTGNCPVCNAACWIAHTHVQPRVNARALCNWTEFKLSNLHWRENLFQKKVFHGKVLLVEMGNAFAAH